MMFQPILLANAACPFSQSCCGDRPYVILHYLWCHLVGLIGADWISDLLGLHISVFTPLLATVAAKKSLRDNWHSWLPAQTSHLEGRLFPKWHPLPHEGFWQSPCCHLQSRTSGCRIRQQQSPLTPDPGCPLPTPKRGAAIVYWIAWWPQADSQDRPPTWCWLDVSQGLSEWGTEPPTRQPPLQDALGSSPYMLAGPESHCPRCIVPHARWSPGRALVLAKALSAT